MNNAKRIRVFGWFLSLSIWFLYALPATGQTPPVAPVRNIVEDHFGMKVTDPYRYMENFKDAEVQAWVKGQADYASSMLKLIPRRDALLSRIKELSSGAPFRIFSIHRLPDSSLFYLKLLATDNIPKLYLRDGKTGEERLLIDPEKRGSSDGKHFAIDFYEPSPDGKYVAYGIAKGGSEQAVLHVLDVSTGQDLKDVIERIENAYTPPKWLPDSKAFFYCRRQKLPPDAPATEGYKKTRAYLHVLGTDPEEDQSGLGMGEATCVKIEEVDFPSIILTHGSRYAVGQIKHGDENELTLYAARLDSVGKPGTQWEKICGMEDAVTAFTVHKDDVYLLTSKDAPRFKIVRSSLASPDFSKAEVVVPASEAVLERITAAKDALYVGILEGGVNRILRVDFGKKTRPGRPERLELPNGASGYVISASPRMEGALISTAAWMKGGVIYAFDPQTKKFADAGLRPKGKFDDVLGYESVEVKAKSHDGVMVPLSIIYKSGVKLDGSNPTLLVGYGSYGFSMSVHFNPLYLAWLERGAVLAFAHVRGGGEYGKEWHLAGRQKTKPNTWKDFIACAEYLIEKKYTSPSRLAGQGTSAGGILIGRAITERPDLFAAAIINVGCLDMVRIETTTNGIPNIPEFGSVKTEEGFKALYEMSAFHHVKDGAKYPAALLTHGVNDPRVEPWLSAKMAARLQAATSSGKPILFRVDYDAGHGIGSTRSQYQEVLADGWAFLLWQFGMKEFQPSF